jgi:hypothetical protein
MDVLRTQRFLPVLGSVLPHVPKLCRACGHALLELGGKGGERLLRDPEGFESLEAESHG